MDFSKISLKQKENYYNIWAQTPRHSLDYTLANLWGWQEYYGLEWQFTANICWIRQTRPHEVWWAPLGDWNAVDWQNLLTSMPAERNFTRIPEELANLWLKAAPNELEISEDRGQWEYLYRQEDLANLAGNKFHKKKNHYNSYVKTYGEPDYQPVTDDHVTDVLSVQHIWCDCHECDDSPSLRAENEAINRVLTHWSEFRNMRGGTLTVDNKMIAFSVGEALDSETLGVHFEKGLNGYKGVYQAMNLQFAKNAGAGFKWINRAQDLDEEGLRQAKMTYLPADFLRKFRVKVKKG